MIFGVLALIVAALTVLLVRTAGQAKNRTVELETAQAEIRRLEGELEQAKKKQIAFAAQQPNAADLAVGTSAAVEIGTAVIEAGHKTLAEGAFKVLGSFESTRDAGKAAQKLHDDNVDGVYAAINGWNRALGDAFRGFTSRSAPAKSAETTPEPTSEI